MRPYHVQRTASLEATEFTHMADVAKKEREIGHHSADCKLSPRSRSLPRLTQSTGSLMTQRLVKPARCSRRKTKDLIERLRRTQSLDIDNADETCFQENASFVDQGEWAPDRVIRNEEFKLVVTERPRSRKIAELTEGKFPIRGQRGSRVSIRFLRAQRKAATTIQAIYRGYVCRKANRSKAIQAEYLEYIKSQRERQAWIDEQHSGLMTRLLFMEKQTELEIEKMRSATQTNMALMEAVTRNFQATQDNNVDPIDDLLFKEIILQADSEIAQLKREQSQITSEISLWEDLVTGLEQEGAELLASNETTRNMFNSLNEFAKASVADKMLLEYQARIYNRFEVNKAREALKTFSSFAMVEMSSEELYRGHLYRYVYSLQDPGLFNQAIAMLRECEESLGNAVLGKEEAATLLEPRIDENFSDSDDENDDSDF